LRKTRYRTFSHGCCCYPRLENRCTACQTVNPHDANFYKKCGAVLRPGVTAITSHVDAPADTQRAGGVLSCQSSDALEGERKTVTAVFADIRGSTELLERLDPEEARALIDPALKLMIDAVNHYDGYIVQSTGDGILRTIWSNRLIVRARGNYFREGDRLTHSWPRWS
jgi:hypothetical protein